MYHMGSIRTLSRWTSEEGETSVAGGVVMRAQAFDDPAGGPKMTQLVSTRFCLYCAACALLLGGNALAQVTPTPAGPDLEVEDARVRYIQELDMLVFEQQVAGVA